MHGTKKKIYKIWFAYLKSNFVRNFDLKKHYTTLNVLYQLMH
jgi:hypothetical protein